MAEPTEPTGTGGDPGSQAPPVVTGSETAPDAAGPTLTQAQVNALLAAERRRWQRDAEQRAEAARLEAAGEHKTLAEQRAARIAELEAEVARRDLAALRAKVAAAHGVGPFADRLQGTTEEELIADAKAFAAALPQPVAPPPAPAPQPGAPTNAARPPVTGAAPALTFGNLPSWSQVLGPPKS